jgi:hypothetical protein
MSKQPRLEVDEDGIKRWYLNGEYHREDGPAIIHLDGEKAWYLKGKLHRIDGPAIEYPNGLKFWFIRGYGYNTKEEWFQRLTAEQQYNYLWNLDE